MCDCDSEQSTVFDQTDNISRILLHFDRARTELKKAYAEATIVRDAIAHDIKCRQKMIEGKDKSIEKPTDEVLIVPETVFDDVSLDLLLDTEGMSSYI